MNLFDYYLNDCILQGWRNVGWAFTAWKDFITSNYRNYDYFETYTQEDKEWNVRFDFWDALEDDIIPKAELDHVRAIIERIENGTEKVIPFTQAMVDRMTELVGDVDVDLNETLDVMFEDD